MIPLNDSQTWEQLDSAYDNAQDIPEILNQFITKPTQALADELIWEYLYHQENVYNSTLASYPYLVEVASNTEDKPLLFNLILSLATLSIFIGNIENLDVFFDSNLSIETKNTVKQSYIKSFEKYKKLVDRFIIDNTIKDIETQGYFLCAYLVRHEKYLQAEVFNAFVQAEEYVFICPSCQKEWYLENKGSSLVAYAEDYINSNAIPIPLDIDDNQHLPKEQNANLDFIANVFEQLKISQLIALLPSFRGSLTCSCGSKHNIYDGILEGYRHL